MFGSSHIYGTSCGLPRSSNPFDSATPLRRCVFFERAFSKGFDSSHPLFFFFFFSTTPPGNLFFFLSGHFVGAFFILQPVFTDYLICQKRPVGLLFPPWRLYFSISQVHLVYPHSITAVDFSLYCGISFFPLILPRQKVFTLDKSSRVTSFCWVRPFYRG